MGKGVSWNESMKDKWTRKEEAKGCEKRKKKHDSNSHKVWKKMKIRKKNDGFLNFDLNWKCLHWQLKDFNV